MLYDDAVRMGYRTPTSADKKRMELTKEDLAEIAKNSKARKVAEEKAAKENK
jgi:hypothetical protein